MPVPGCSGPIRQRILVGASPTELLTGNDAAKVHLCAGRDCGWAYVNRSHSCFRLVE